jgi:hypothetical protein
MKEFWRFVARRRATLFCSIGASMICLGGCSDIDLKLIERDNKQLIAEAMSSPSPWAAAGRVDQRILHISQASYCWNGWINKNECLGIPSYTDLRNSSEILYRRAANQLEPEAVYQLFVENKEFGSGDESPKRNIANKVVALADTSNDAKILVTAGHILSKGDYATKDHLLAIDYYARAWATGTNTAAEIAVLYFESHDLNNAYLWALRCIGECGKKSYPYREKLEKKLSGEAIKQAQIAAKDNTVVSLALVKE